MKKNQIKKENVGRQAEIEAALLISSLMEDSNLALSFGVGKTTEGAFAPDLVMHPRGWIPGETRMAKALLVKHRNRWKITIIDLPNHSLPELNFGMVARLRKRPRNICKNPEREIFGMAEVAQAICVKAINWQSIPTTYLTKEIVEQIEKWIYIYGPFTFDVKNGANSQLANVNYYADRRSGKLEVTLPPNSSFSDKNQKEIIGILQRYGTYHICDYFDRLTECHGSQIDHSHIFKYEKRYQNDSGWFTIAPRDSYHIPVETLKRVPFNPVIAGEKTATKLINIVYARKVSGYKIEEFKRKNNADC